MARVKKRDQGARRIEEILERGVNWRRSALALTTLFALSGVVLLGVAPIREIAFAAGEIRATALTSVVRHGSGGDVVRVFAGVDEVVEAGQPLLALDGRALTAELERLRGRLAHAALRRDRLAALVEDRPLAVLDTAGLEMADIDNAERLFDAERADFDAERAAAEALLAERRAELEALEASAISLAAERAALAEQSSIADGLVERGLGRETARLEAIAQLADVEARIAENTGRREAMIHSLAQLDADLRRVAAQRRADWSTQLLAVRAEIADLVAAIADAEARIDTLVIVAPISGRVLELGAATAGDALSPGGLAAVIAPADLAVEDAVVAEVRLSPDDVGHVRPGDEATIDVSTFEAEWFGEITGVVQTVSAAAVSDDQGGRYFRVVLALDRTSTALGDDVLRLSPGMRVSAQIPTADTTVLGRLLDPVSDALQVVLAER